MNILMSAFTGRCLMNWLPLATKIRASGGRCDFLLFPRLKDPDHKVLYRRDIQEFALITAPIDEIFEFCETTESECIAEIQRSVTGGRYAGLLMTTCHLGPELKLKQWIQAVSPKTRAIGLQHGFVQVWSDYEKLFGSYDYLGVFGSAFIHYLSEPFRNRVIPLAPPYLDSYSIENPQHGQSVIFALQKDLPLDKVEQLGLEFATLTGKQVVLRPHPEHVMHYDGLRRTFEFSDPAESLLLALRRASSVITSGSTLALAALSMKIPTAIIRHLGGEEYEPFGIVADDLTALSILSVLERYRNPAFWIYVSEILKRYTGQPGCRVDDTYESLCALFEDPSDGKSTTFFQGWRWLRNMANRLFARSHPTL